MTVADLLEQASEINQKDPRARGDEIEILARSLAARGDTAIPELIEAAQHTNSLIAQTARVALGRMGSDAARQAIAPLLVTKNNDTIRRFALNWIGKHPSQESVDLLTDRYYSIEATSTAEWMEKEDIVRILRRVVGEYPSAQEVVIHYTDNPPNIQL